MLGSWITHTVEWYESVLKNHPQVKEIQVSGSNELFEVHTTLGFMFAMDLLYEKNQELWCGEIKISSSYDHDDIFMVWEPDMFTWLFEAKDFSLLKGFIETHEKLEKQWWAEYR